MKNNVAQTAAFGGLRAFRRRFHQIPQTRPQDGRVCATGSEDQKETPLMRKRVCSESGSWLAFLFYMLGAGGTPAPQPAASDSQHCGLGAQLGRLFSRPKAGLESPANRRARKPAPHVGRRITGLQLRNFSGEDTDASF